MTPDRGQASGGELLTKYFGLPLVQSVRKFLSKNYGHLFPTAWLAQPQYLALRPHRGSQVGNEGCGAHVARDSDELSNLNWHFPRIRKCPQEDDEDELDLRPR